MNPGNHGPIANRRYRFKLPGSVLCHVTWALCLIALFGSAGAVFGQLRETKIVSSDVADGDFFGESIAIEGPRVVIGVRTADLSGVSNAGAAYVFERIDGDWQEVAKLTASVPSERDFFGESVATDGNWIFVGAMGNDDRKPEGGAVYAFQSIDGQWRQVQIIYPLDPQDFHGFGWEIALQGDRLLIGAPQDDEVKISAGAVYVFECLDGVWRQVQKLLPDTAGNVASFFGTTMGLDGDRLIIGSPTDATSGPQAGAAYVFELVNNRWQRIQKLLPPPQTPPDSVEQDTFAREVALHGNWALVGSGDDEQCIQDELFNPEFPNACTSGAVFAYQRQASGRWELRQKIAPLELEQFDFFGFLAIAIEDNLAVVGARGDDDACPDPPPPIPLFCDTGAIYVFERINDVWQQVNKLTAPAAMAEDLLGGTFFGQGRPLGISGSHVVAGAPTLAISEDPRPKLGAAYIFKLFNRNPTARDDRVTTSQDAPVEIDVLSNDSDPDFDALTVSIATPPSSGLVSINNAGSHATPATITYTPLPGFSGRVTFSYQIDDGDGGTDRAMVTVNDLDPECGSASPANGDSDRDGDVDLGDFVAFQGCFTGSSVALVTADACLCTFDADGDGDIDLADFLALADVFARSP